MNNIKLFHINDGHVEKLDGNIIPTEKELHLLLEKHLQVFFGVSMLAREYSTGRTHKGYIDTLGIDENFCPVILEYKRKSNDNVITQGLFYLDWLLDHRAEFTELTRRKLGAEAAASIEFSGARVLCIAASFSRFDERAIMQIDRNIELVRYELFEGGLLLLESLNNFISPFIPQESPRQENASQADVGMPPALQTRLKNMNQEAEAMYLALISFGEQLGEDVSIKFLKHYVAMQRNKNFTCIQPARGALKLWLNLDPEDFELEAGFSRNVRDIGHHASGNLELDIKNMEDLEKAKPLIAQAYQLN